MRDLSMEVTVTVEWDSVTPTKEPPKGMNHLELVWEARGGGTSQMWQGSYKWDGKKWIRIMNSNEIPEAGHLIGEVKEIEGGRFHLTEITLSR